MKKHAFAIAVLLALFLTAAAGPANAQQSFKVSIPFDFVVDKATLPAGDYVIQRPGIGAPGALLMQRVDGDAAVIVMTLPARAKDWQPETCLVFQHYSDGYFLSQMWTSGNESGLQFYESPREKELLASNAISRRVTLLAGLSAPKH